MKTLTGLLAILAAFAWIPSRAEAQRRGSSVYTPYGKFSMNDMAAAGGNPYAAGSMREQKMMMLYQQQMVKQQQLGSQQIAKQQKGKQDYLKAHPEVAKTQAAAKAKANVPRLKSAVTKKAQSSTTTPAAKSATIKAPGSLKASRGSVTSEIPANFR